MPERYSWRHDIAVYDIATDDLSLAVPYGVSTNSFYPTYFSSRRVTLYE